MSNLVVCNFAKWTILCIVVHFQPVIKLKLLRKGARVHHRRVILMQEMQKFFWEGTRPLHTTTPHLPRGGFVTRIKTITPVISRLIKYQWRCAACWPRYAVSTHDKRSVRDGFSRRLRGVWFGYIVESGRKSEWCINALLSKQLLITICYTYTAAVTYTFHHCACAPCLYLLQKLEAAPPPMVSFAQIVRVNCLSSR